MVGGRPPPSLLVGAAPKARCARLPHFVAARSPPCLAHRFAVLCSAAATNGPVWTCTGCREQVEVVLPTGQANARTSYHCTPAADATSDRHGGRDGRRGA